MAADEDLETARSYYKEPELALERLLNFEPVLDQSLIARTLCQMNFIARTHDHMNSK